jgi:hypothetical protein
MCGDGYTIKNRADRWERRGRGSISKNVKVYKEKNMVLDPEGARYQE